MKLHIFRHGGLSPSSIQRVPTIHSLKSFRYISTTNILSNKTNEENVSKPSDYLTDTTNNIFSSYASRNKLTQNKNANVANIMSPRDFNSKTGTINTIKYVLSCRFTKNNTHITYSAVVEDTAFQKKNPNLSYNEMVLYYMKLPQKVKFAISTGCLGFRKAARGEYEAGFQTATKAFQMIEEKGLTDKKIEIVMRDFGKGRSAFVAALNGKEGNNIRKYVARISDKTPLKFGGVRSPKIRRL
ncbi:mitochondrial 37S ribosomal protein uS11m NDAI_0A06220 [Naumovozyma dairenensis CBS 421]|uniref:Small ribosomal subunit protein uS11m n=1 Tax=Naumovozyma dairenensis (strain ATCC 10597 / BCRC 20456 / CBS 421 / NBRC 0211 / NRRL Y-12639) TaxID=1071378 RepID=G0W4N8_NAUDC|nr:hypothetical protein NDAI_0A06220 [Naumovozyma dairenensis CBS 421]CCD22776.1 hypothetical protein NDAI_0A06220 [Naumovozyma dairenensis CBS 421]